MDRKDIVRVISFQERLYSGPFEEILQEDITGRIGVVEHVYLNGSLGVTFSDVFKVHNPTYSLMTGTYWIFREHQLEVLFTS